MFFLVVVDWNRIELGKYVRTYGTGPRTRLILPSRIRTSSLPNRADVLAARGHAEAAIQADVRRSCTAVGSAAAAVLGVGVAWVVGGVEFGAVEGVAFLLGGC